MAKKKAGQRTVRVQKVSPKEFEELKSLPRKREEVRRFYRLEFVFFTRERTLEIYATNDKMALMHAKRQISKRRRITETDKGKSYTDNTADVFMRSLAFVVERRISIANL